MSRFNPNGPVEKAILAAAEKYPFIPDAKFTYGTAGFRMNEGRLDFIMFAMGILAGVASRKMGELTIGVMITASHNKAQDNGVKLVGPQGEMLDKDWENAATYIANAESAEVTRDRYGWLIEGMGIDTTKKARVIIARDTRPSGVRLSQAVKDGAEAVGATVIDYGVLTTPQLHYLVKATNTQNSNHPYGEVSEEGYYKKLAVAFKAAMDDAKSNSSVTVDCANGVGAPKLKEMLKHLPSPEEGGLKIRIVNDRIDQAELLNNDCGADYVKTNNAMPAGYDGKNFDRWASYDGDADRILYYYNSDGPIFHLLDGDKISTLCASFIGELVQKAGLGEKIKLSIVQTAYANGASTKYVEQVLKLKVDCTNTGVKHLHHAAARADIGVYFEANGHGTVLFSTQAMKRIYNYEPQSPAQADALNTLKALTELINQTVGDAISDMLLVEVVLAHKGWTVKEWLGTYTDMPNKLVKALVGDRAAYTTVEGTAEQKLASPPLQPKIDSIVQKYKGGRCFVRASGTEEAVRIYGEAEESYDVDDMVSRVAGLIAQYEGQNAPATARKAKSEGD